MTVAVYAFATTAAGFLLVLAIILPVAGVLLSLVLGGRHAERIALAVMPAGFGVAIAIAVLLWRSGKPLVYILGGFIPPLGIALRADGFSAVMLVAAALVILAAGFFARANFWTPPGVREARAPLAFWTLLQGLWAALNIVFIGGDLFNLYVALELLTFAAVPLVCLDGRPETLAAALRYLLFALFGSVFYLLGAALLYGAYGTLDIVLLAARIHAEPAVRVAAGLITAGLLAKTALFPLHLWLPPAHANAPAAASAVLSALVVKASFFVVVRLWFNVLPSPPNEIACAILAALGSVAILFGSVLALRQERLKLLIAYSTVAQIGYLFLMFPLAAGAHPWAVDAWSGGLMQLLASAPREPLARCAGGNAARRRSAALDRRRRLRRRRCVGQAECRALCGLLAADADRQSRRLHRRRSSDVLSCLRSRQHPSLRADHA
jgi:multicomponent Na+:H+ antiporter subunit D